MEAAIIRLPLAGKSAFFKALTGLTGLTGLIGAASPGRGKALRVADMAVPGARVEVVEWDRLLAVGGFNV